MGGTWLMEILSWAIKGPTWVWIVPDVINSLRGVFIFYFCVWSNKKIRISLLSRVSSRYRSRDITGQTNSRSFASKESAIMDSSVMSGNDQQAMTPLNSNQEDTAL
jgi:hypothetical protein